MADDRSSLTRRHYLTGAVVSLGGTAGCVGFLDNAGESETPGEGGGESGYSGPLQVNGTERLDGEGQMVKVAVTVENTGDAARLATLVLELSHTEAQGSIDRKRPVLLASGLERDVVLAFQPRFVGDDGFDRPEEGEFRFDATFENDEVYADYPGLVTPSSRSAIAGGDAWPAVAYDPGASAATPGTEAPRSLPTSAWSVSAVEYAYDASGPVVANGTVYAGRNVRALSVEDGTEQWVHDGAARTSTLAVGDGVVAFGTPEDVRAIEAGSGDVRWTVSSDGEIWDGGPTIVDGRVYTSNGRLHAIDAASGEVLWTADASGALVGPPPVADDVVLAGGDPLRAIDVADGSVRWTAASSEPIAAATIAYDTVFALTPSKLLALDLSEGRVRWFAPGPFQEERIAVGSGSVYAQRANDYRMIGLDAANGNVEWVSQATDGVLGPPSASDGVLVVTSEQGTLYGFDTETGEKLWAKRVPSSVPGSLAVADGVTYFNEPSGPLRALQAEE